MYPLLNANDETVTRQNEIVCSIHISQRKDGTGGRSFLQKNTGVVPNFSELLVIFW